MQGELFGGGVTLIIGSFTIDFFGKMINFSVENFLGKSFGLIKVCCECEFACG
jgi:hypothetical protein